MTAGFSVAARVGLLLAAGFAAISALDPDARLVRVLTRHHRRVRTGLGLVLAAWAVATLARVPLLDRQLPPDAAPQPLGLVALLGVGLSGIAAVRYADLDRRRHRPLPLAVLVAFVLLAEAMLAMAFARTWHAMWWECHVLMAVAFGAIVVAARVEYGREGSLTAVFGGIYLDSTLRRIDRRDARRLAEVVDGIRSGRPVDQLLARFRDEGMSRVAAGAARLGGEEREVSVLFADLAGFTAFSAERPASEVVEMLNRYWAAAVPAVVRDGGCIERFAVDAVIIAFNAVTDQPDHAMRAARAALAVSSGAERLAAGHAGWPQFRIAVTTGSAVVGNVGADLRRSFTVIGDTINLAAPADQGASRRGRDRVHHPGGPRRPRHGGPAGSRETEGRPEPVPVYRLVSVSG
jgi:class 3 adenylate cyclase